MADTNNEATSPAPAALIIHGIPVGVPVPVDAELDPDSNNPVSNKAVSEKFNEINTHLSQENSYTSTNVYGTFTIKRHGDTVTVGGTLTNIPSSAWTSLLSGIPKPITARRFVNTNSAGTNDVSIALTTNGTIQYYGRNTETTCDLSIEYTTIE